MMGPPTDRAYGWLSASSDTRTMFMAVMGMAAKAQMPAPRRVGGWAVSTDETQPG